MNVLKSWMHEYLKKERCKIAVKYIYGDSVLDLGCGNGLFSTYVKGKYLGIDNDEKDLKLARSISPDKKFMNLTIDERLDINEKFSTITALAFIEHMKDYSFLNGAINSLSPKGRLILTTPTKNADWILHKFISAEKGKHERYYNKEDFQKIAAELNLNLIVYEKFQLGLNQVVVMEKP